MQQSELSSIMDSSEMLDIDEDEYRQVSATGTFNVEGQVLISGRTRDGAAGYYVATPLVLSGTERKVVYVNRGWIPQALGDAMRDGSATNEAIAPVGGYDVEREVVGLIRKNEPKQLLGDEKQIAKQKPVAARLSSEIFEEVSGVENPDDLYELWIHQNYQVVDGKKVANESDSAAAFPTPLEQPELTEMNHFSYAMQWIIFGVIALITWGVICKKALEKNRKVKDVST